MADLMVTRGDTIVLNLTVSDEDGQPLNLDGASLTFSARQVDAAAPAISVPGVLTAPEAGEAQVTLEPADTLALADDVTALDYDVQLLEADGSITTVSSGTLEVRPRVSAVAA